MRNEAIRESGVEFGRQPMRLTSRPRLRVFLVIPHLGGGGAERVVAQLARYLDPTRFEIHLVLITRDRAGAGEIPAWVQVHRCECQRVRDGWWKLLRLVWREEPEVVFSGMAHLSFLVLLLRPLFGRRTRVVVRQNTTASMATVTVFARLCYRWLYPSADAIVCQSEAMAGDLVDVFGIGRSKLHVLRNPVELKLNQDRKRDRLGRVFDRCEAGSHWADSAWPRLLSVGRLSREKGFDLMLGAIRIVQKEYPHLQAIVLGEGESRGDLERLAKELGLADAVRFPGHSEAVAEFYEQADLFVLPSRYEGMPNALLEAAGWGLPLVSTPCSGGVIEVLQDAPGASLSATVSAPALAEAISRSIEVLRDASDSEHAGLGGRTRFEHAFLAPFERRRAVEGFEELFLRLGRPTDTGNSANQTRDRVTEAHTGV